MTGSPPYFPEDQLIARFIRLRLKCVPCIAKVWTTLRQQASHFQRLEVSSAPGNASGPVLVKVENFLEVLARCYTPLYMKLFMTCWTLAAIPKRGSPEDGALLRSAAVTMSGK